MKSLTAVMALFSSACFAQVPFGASKVGDVEIFVMELKSPPREVLERMFPGGKVKANSEYEGVFITILSPETSIGRNDADVEIEIVARRADGLIRNMKLTQRYDSSRPQPLTMGFRVGTVRELLHVSIRIESRRHIAFGSHGT